MLIFLSYNIFIFSKGPILEPEFYYFSFEITRENHEKPNFIFNVARNSLCQQKYLPVNFFRYLGLLKFQTS